jgi:nucleotide-binding universal stress UspA family protein
MRFDDLKLILVPTDFSDASTTALDAAVKLAQTFHAAIEILHVDLDSALVLPPPGDAISLPIAVEGALARAAEELKRIVAEVSDKNLACTGASESGRTYGALVEHAARIRADLIVMGSHGRHGLRHRLLGSVAEKVVRDAPCAVLVVPVSPKT